MHFSQGTVETVVWGLTTELVSVFVSVTVASTFAVPVSVRSMLATCLKTCACPSYEVRVTEYNPPDSWAISLLT